MDSITQAILWASIAEFLGGKKYGNKAALVGAIVATIPDLDVFIGPLLYGDTLQAELFHRSVTHSLLFSILLAPIVGRVISKIIRGPKESSPSSNSETRKSSRRDRTIISFRALATHRMLDLLTWYGTKWLRPFSQMPFAADSVFILDPLYTIPFFIFLMIALFYHQSSKKRRFWNGLALIVSTIYLLRWLGMKQVAQQTFLVQLEQRGVTYQTVNASAEPLTTFLRRGRAQDDENRYIGRRSIFDQDNEIALKTYPKNHELLIPYLQDPDVQKILARRRYNVSVKPTAQGITLTPMQFGDLLWWNQAEPNFMFSYDLVLQWTGVQVLEPTRWRQIPTGRFHILLKRIFGQENDIPIAPTTTVWQQCSTNDECETPMDYLIRSICPFQSKCVEGTCAVVCIDRYNTEKGELRKDPQCSSDDECNCKNFYGADDIKACKCIDTICTAIVAH